MNLWLNRWLVPYSNLYYIQRTTVQFGDPMKAAAFLVRKNSFSACRTEEQRDMGFRGQRAWTRFQKLQWREKTSQSKQSYRSVKDIGRRKDERPMNCLYGNIDKYIYRIDTPTKYETKKKMSANNFRQPIQELIITAISVTEGNWM